MNDMLICELFKLFNTVVLRHTEDDFFVPVATLPEWFVSLVPEAAASDASIALADYFPFLQDFIPEAHSFWAHRRDGRLRSGIWLESLADGSDLALGASALCLLDKPILLIESPQFSYDELYNTIQTGRDLALVHHDLSRTESAVRQDRDVLLERLEERNIELEAINRQLRESEARFRLLFEQLFDAQVMFADHGAVEDANRAACRLFGMTREELQQTRLDQLFASAEAQKVQKLLQHLPDREIEFLGEIQVKGTAIHPTPVEAGGVALTIGGRHYGLVSFRDITERKQLQTQLQQAQKMEAIGTLAGGIAHDFNNVLAAVLGYNELAMLEMTEDDRAYRSITEAIKACQRGKNLVNQILTFSRQDEQRKKALVLSQAVVETLKMVRALIPVSIDIRTQIKPGVGIVEADPTQIHQVILNLCTNAAHAIGQARGTITVGLDCQALGETAARIHPELRPGTYACLTVADSGEGIPDELLNKIFEPYFTTKDSGQGTGIGLATTHGIVRSHGGVITAASQVGEGSVFKIYLPRAEGQVACEPGGQVEKPTGSERILFVDDEETLQDIGRRMLVHLGYRVEVLGDSLEALELFTQSPQSFDLVITDMTMPNMTGEELAQRLLAIRPDLPIILCTGYSEKITPEKARRMGIRDFLMKPLTIEQLAAKVRGLLDNTCSG
jgi:PAS domain S-box-containing protein